MAKNRWILPDGFDKSSREAVKAILSALETSGKEIPPEAFTALQLGDVAGFLEFVNWDQIRNEFGDLTEIMRLMASTAGQSTFTMGGVQAQLLFDLIDARAVDYAQKRVGELIVDIGEQMRETVRDTIARASAGEMTYQQAALRLQSTISLTSRDAGAVNKFIEKQYQRFMRSGLSDAKARIKAQNMGAKYASKLLRSRTNTIARTEIADAAMAGRYLGWEAGVTAGLISNESVKEWIAEPNACPICKALDGKVIGWNEAWDFPEGVSAGLDNNMPPAHPNCRCSVAILPPDFADNVFTPSSGGEMSEEAEEFTKHLPGKHDQSSHGGRRSVGRVPKNVDLDGQRFSEAERTELGKRASNAENTKQLRKAQMEREIFGADYQNLPAYSTGDESKRIPTPEFLRGSRYDTNGTIEPSQDMLRTDEWRAVVDADPQVLAAKANLEEHFLYREAVGLKSAKGGTMGEAYAGDNVSPTAKLTHYSKFPAERLDESGFERTLLKNTQEDASMFPDPNFEVKTGRQKITKQEAIDKANEDWETFMAEGEPQVIMSATAVQRVVTSERVKTVHEIARPGRAGTGDENYVDSRRVYENAAFGYTGDTSPELRPVSGLMGGGEPYSEYLDIYGGKNPAVVTLKPEVKERTTYTLGDSLNGYEQPSPVNAPRPRAQNYSSAQAGSYGKATGKNWYKDHKMGAPEIQIHGGVTLADIATITFFGTPSASVIATMERKGVPYTIDTPTGTGGLE